MADHTKLPNLRRPAIWLALKLGWDAVLIVAIETLGRSGEAFAQLTGLAAVLLLQLMSVALLVRALADSLVALFALILALAAAQTPTQEPVTT
ncbi:hypothetical protein M9M90_11990 [Phenylobacterium sp. LH3H17]|uniref:hypothetical protein n=1 Tax=Phenylobacterium sp. LH3H17 TaxID=2903901 RepID=UPI0020C9A0F9|nr:hypothetical protein [Phenylobacterium sp. LH3H17]UTP37960.1 hypothetical protein M9M90_11990 [Phenylobacterium sp. LH3H17]